MTTRKRMSGMTLAAVFLLTGPCMAASQPGPYLANENLRADFAGVRLVGLTDLKSGFKLRLTDESFLLAVDGENISPENLRLDSFNYSRSSLSIHYGGLRHRVNVIYELLPGWKFLAKQIAIEPMQPKDLRIEQVQGFAAGMDPDATEEIPLSQGNTWGTLLRYTRPGGTKPVFAAFLLYQNPFNVWRRDGSRISVSYAPGIVWKSSDGAYVSDRFCIGTTALSGNVFPLRAIPEWTFVPDYQKYLAEHAVIDMAEADALVQCVRSFLLYRPDKSIRVHVPWCENDYQIDVAAAEGWEEFRRIIDRAVDVGCQYTLYTPANSELSNLKENRDAWGWENLLFFGMGQKIRKGEWDPARDPVPPSLQRTLDYAKSKNIKLISYSYPSVPFLQDPEWTRWAAGKVGGYNGPDTGMRSFQDWWIGKLVDFVKATGAGGYSFDYWWIAYDNASSRYGQWSGCRRILETLRRRIPEIVIDGRQQYMNFGPWTWLAGSYPHPSLTDEQPESFVSFPDLHTDRVSANRQRFAAWTYRMQRFCPPEILPGFITHQTERSDAGKVMRRDRFRPRDWDMLGWRFSVLSSIGTAPFNHVVNYIPARDPDEFRAFADEDMRWFRGWLDWTDQNASMLRNLKPIIGPPMIGRVDGTAACDRDRGFVFLFNPNYRQLDAAFALDASIGLAQGGPFILEELYPEPGRLLAHPQNGIWKPGDRVVQTVSGNQAMVLEIRPAQPMLSRPMLFQVRGTATSASDRLVLTEVVGEVGTVREFVVRMPARTKIASVTANGVRVPHRQAGNLISGRIRFAGEAFTRSQPLWSYDPGFAGGTLKAAFKIPARIFAQLKARRLQWPVPFTDDDLIAPWLGPYRLLLYAHIAEPDASQEIVVTIDGKAHPVRSAYNNIYGGNPRNFLGSYIDLSDLEAEREHTIEVTLPRLAAGRFQGLFFENVEPEYTRAIIQ